MRGSGRVASPGGSCDPNPTSIPFGRRAFGTVTTAVALGPFARSCELSIQPG